MQREVDRVPKIKDAKSCAYDLVALGEVMLRLDPGEDRISHAVQFRAWEGGGEYNVAKAISACFALRSAIVTSLADNPVGDLVCGRIRQGGVDTRFVHRDSLPGSRVGLNFTERGFGARSALGVSDRAGSCASRMKPIDVDWDAVFGEYGSRWFHTGGIFAALSEDTAALTLQAVQKAKQYGTVVSYDLNYRPSLWQDHGGREAAASLNRRILPFVDVLFGNETDFYDALGIGESNEQAQSDRFYKCAEQICALFPNVSVVASSLRLVRSACENDWSGAAYADGQLFTAQGMPGLEILDRVGGGDSFASGVIYGMLCGESVEKSLALGVAHGALAMSTPGDTSMATVSEVRRLADGGTARIIR